MLSIAIIVDNILFKALIVIEYVRRTVILYRKYTSVPVIFKCLEILLIITLLTVYASGRIFDNHLFKPYPMKVSES